jgi:glycosyltransferase involved in cell wall biosynthesis
MSLQQFDNCKCLDRSKIHMSGRQKKIRILHVLSAKSKRIRPLENLVNGLDRSIFSQVVCYLRGADEEHTELETSGHEILTLDISQEKLRAFQPLAVLQLAKIMKEKGIDVVHCQRHKPTVYGTLAAYIKGKDVKVISHVRGLSRTRSFRRKLLNKALFRRISSIIAVSDAVRDEIVRTNSMYFPDKVVTIYNGIDVQPFMDPHLTREQARIGLGLPDKDAFVYGTVGRLVETKGQDVLIKAFARVYEKYPKSWLIITGEGRLESELRALSAELNIHGRVLFLGYRTDIPKVLKAYDVFVLPSIAEGLPGALLEAMATGKPVIASRVGGVPEILNDPNLGIMVSPSSIDDLASAMKRLCGMDEKRRNMIGDALRERVLEEFTKEKMISAISREYVAVMNEPMGQ